MNSKKRLFHSFYSLFDKDSISKQDFDKLKQFDIFLPKSIFIKKQKKLIQEKEKKIKRRDKRIKSFESEIRNLKSENKKKDKENQEMKIEIEEKWKKEIENKNKEIEEKWKKEVEELKSKFELMELQKKLEPIKKNFPQFSDSEIVKDIEYVKKLQEWINDNDFFSKMKKGFSAKRDGFNSQNWHKAVDGKGKTLVIIKTKQNFIFGGFTQVGFNGNTRYINDLSAFIFSLRNDKGDRIPAKFTYNGNGQAIYSSLSYGPMFGRGSDFALNSDLKTGFSNFGKSYNPPNGITYNTNEARSYLAGSYKSWVVDEVETYFI